MADKVMTAEEKNAKIFKTNPALILQLLSRAKVLNQLQSNGKSKKNSKLDSALKPLFSTLQESVSLSDKLFEKILKRVKKPKNALLEFEKLAKKSGHPKLGEKVSRTANKIPTVVQRVGRLVNKKIPNFGNEELEVEVIKIGETVKNIKKPALSKEFIKVTTAVKLENALRPLKVGKLSGEAIGLIFDVKTLWDFFNKSKGKRKPGEYVDAIISGASIAGAVLEAIALATTATSLLPIASAIGAVAMGAGLIKYFYDISDMSSEKSNMPGRILYVPGSTPYLNSKPGSEILSGPVVFPMYGYNDWSNVKAYKLARKKSNMPKNTYETFDYSGSISLGKNGMKAFALGSKSNAYGTSYLGGGFLLGRGGPKVAIISGNNVSPKYNKKLSSNKAFKSAYKESKIARNASGTTYFSGGLSLVGEEGPELVNLPRGSQVFPNSRTKGLLQGMSGGNAGISINYAPQITIQGNADAKMMKTASDNSYADFERKFNALMDRRRRLSFAGG